MSIVQSALERAKSNRVPDARAAKTRAPVPAPAESMSPAAGSLRLPAIWTGGGSTVPINYDRLREHSLYPTGDSVRRQQDDYRSIRREVIAATRQSPSPESAPIGPIVVVTSALPGDGKSYTALNLALSMASEGIHDVLLIDGDTVRHSLSSAFDLEASPGLIDVLARPGKDFMQFTHPTSIDRLRFLAAGRHYDGASDLFSVGRVAPLFAAIGAALEGHVVIVDTAPILLSSETPVLTDTAGQVLLVIRAGLTLQDSIKEAASRIKSSVPVGLVLNAWEPVLPSEKKAYNGYEAYEKRQA
jgi:Mrp family chromosome partitioning ATPase